MSKPFKLRQWSKAAIDQAPNPDEIVKCRFCDEKYKRSTGVSGRFCSDICKERYQQKNGYRDSSWRSLGDGASMKLRLGLSEDVSGGTFFPHKH